MLNKTLKIVVAATLTLSPGFLHANTSQQLTDCRKLADSSARLQCYDQLALSVEQTLQTATATATATKELATVAKAAPTAAETVLTAVPATAPVVKALATPVKAAAQEKAAYTAEVIENDFGRAQERPSDAIDELKSTIKSISQNNYRKLVITLANGHVWRQSDSYAIQLKAGDEIVIEKASLGSFLLGRAGSDRKIRVKRIE